MNGLDFDNNVEAIKVTGSRASEEGITFFDAMWIRKTEATSPKWSYERAYTASRFQVNAKKVPNYRALRTLLTETCQRVAR